MADPQGGRIGQQIGDYRLQRRLGRGTFGTVYLAEHLHDHSQAAIKLLQLQLTSHNDLRDFLNEARTIRLRHPHIVSILDFGLSRDDLPYLAMEYAAGGTLHDRHPRGSKVPWETIGTYIQDLASALQYAHDRRVIHRDVKPENMLLRADGTVLLSDFGIAKILEQTSLMSLHKGAGTPAYAAPEQSQGNPGPASDQYALAVVVYEWLAGQLPFQGGALQVVLHHRTDPPPPLHVISPEVSEQVEQVLFTALAKGPAERFPTIMNFAQVLLVALQERKVSQPTDSHLVTPSTAITPVHLPVVIPQALSISFVPAPPGTSGWSQEAQSAAKPSSPLPAELPLRSPPATVEALNMLPPAPIPEAKALPALRTLETRPTGSSRVSARFLVPRRLLVTLLGLLLLISMSGGGTWLYLAQQNQHHAQDATALSPGSATATPALLNTVKELGCPQADKSSSIYQSLFQLADGNTTYTFASHATDKTGGKCTQTNKPLRIAGVMFKLWLTNRVPLHKILQLPADALMHTEQLSQPITGKIDDTDYPEIANALQFDPNIKQLQPSNDQGQANWTYKLDPNLKDGDYSLVILSDWQGNVYNWSWFDIIVKKQG